MAIENRSFLTVVVPSGTVKISARTELAPVSHLDPRPGWRFTDSNGHEHYTGNDGSLPTLALVVDDWGQSWEPWWDGDDGNGDEGPDVVPVRSHRECLVCGEHVTVPLGPAIGGDTYERVIAYAGEVTYPQSAGRTIHFELAPDEVAEIMRAYNRFLKDGGDQEAMMVEIGRVTAAAIATLSDPESPLAQYRFTSVSMLL